MSVDTQEANTILKKTIFKVHFCIFCKKEFSRLAEHCIRKHKDEAEVREILQTTDEKLKMWKWKALRQQGDNFYNNSYDVGNKKIVRVSGESDKRKRYFDCPVCLGRIRTSSRRQHSLRCAKVFESSEKHHDNDNTEDIFTGMEETIINKLRNSSKIVDFLRHVFEVKQNRMAFLTLARDIVAVEEQLQSLTQQNKPLVNFLTIHYLGFIIKAIKLMGGQVHIEKNKLMRHPYKAKRIVALIRTLSKFLITYYTENSKEADALETTNFIETFDSHYDTLIKKVLLGSIKAKNFLLAKKLPKTSHINILIEKLKKETPELINKLESEKTPSSWRNLAESVLCRLVVFNRKKGSSIEKMTVDDYKRTEIRLKMTKQVSFCNLPPEEEDFLKNVCIVEILHDCDGVIQVFINKELQEAMDILLKYREYAGISTENPYFFAAGKKSVNPISGVKVLEKYRELFPADVQKSFTTTNLRKHGLTVAKLLDLTSQDKEKWASHMSHSVNILDKCYSKEEEVSTILKTGKILTAMDQGAIKLYKGKKLSEIQLQVTEARQEEIENPQVATDEPDGSPQLSDLEDSGLADPHSAGSSAEDPGGKMIADETQPPLLSVHEEDSRPSECTHPLESSIGRQETKEIEPTELVPASKPKKEPRFLDAFNKKLAERLKLKKEKTQGFRFVPEHSREGLSRYSQVRRALMHRSGRYRKRRIDEDRHRYARGRRIVFPRSGFDSETISSDADMRRSHRKYYRGRRGAPKGGFYSESDNDIQRIYRKFYRGRREAYAIGGFDSGSDIDLHRSRRKYYRGRKEVFAKGGFDSESDFDGRRSRRKFYRARREVSGKGGYYCNQITSPGRGERRSRQKSYRGRREPFVERCFDSESISSDMDVLRSHRDLYKERREAFANGSFDSESISSDVDAQISHRGRRKASEDFDSEIDMDAQRSHQELYMGKRAGSFGLDSESTHSDAVEFELPPPKKLKRNNLDSGFSSSKSRHERKPTSVRFESIPTQSMQKHKSRGAPNRHRQQIR